MSILYLIRHGQASFGAANYDQLSATGAEQARCLGEYWARRKTMLHAIYMGPSARHLDTARYLIEGAGRSGMRYPEPVIMPELDEYPAIELIRNYLPRLLQEDPELASSLADAPSQSEAMEQGFIAVVTRWARGEIAAGELESFAEFRARAVAGLTAVMEREGRSKAVAVVTSGGPIGVALQMAFGISDEMSLKAAWTIANTSITELRYRNAQEPVLIRFNTIPHLHDDTLVTYR